jgi:hypothetical protein
MRKIKTADERIGELLNEYERLNREAHELIDSYITELRVEVPGTPFGVIKQTEFHGRAGTSLNMPAALRILRERLGKSGATT